MNRLFVLLIAVVLTAGSQLTGAQQNAAQAEKLLASAEHKATVDGDLKGAIAEYTKIIAAAGSNRALAAEALVRMAECYQKLGDSESQKIYERLVRDYGDQKEPAALARLRLGATGSVARVKGDRAVWSGPDADGFGTISPDGRTLTYTDWITGGLVLRDLATGTDHRLTAGTYDDGGSTQFSAISKDGKQLAYQWMDSKLPADERRYELRVAKLQGTSMSESRRLFDNEEVRSAAPYDWSPDGKWIAVHIGRRDLTGQIGLVAVQDGSLRILKSVDWKGPTKIFFSPDSKYLAYDLMVADKSDERHVHVMAVDGTRETTVVADTSHNIIMGWSPDGQHLLFTSNRSGSFGLWALPVADGKPRGTPTLVKPDTSSIWSVGLTASGTMYVWKYASPIFMAAASIDLAAGKIVPGPAAPFQRFIGTRGRPGWSADGRHLAYQSCAPLGGGPCVLWIRSMETGQLRELRTKLQYFFFPSWSPDGREILTRGTDLKGRQGLYRIDTQTGDVTLVVAPYPGSAMPRWAADGKHVYYRRESSIIERDLASGTEREAMRVPTAGARDFAVSPDGLNVAYSAGEPTSTQSVFVMPFAGGTPRLLLRVNAPERLAWRFDWTSDGRALAIAKERGDTGRKELWLLPVNGEKPRKLDVDVDNWLLDEGGFQLDLAGKQIAFAAAAGKPGLEIRALENFLPAQTNVRPSAKR
jgi:Tol biopolymer transport system component